MKEIIFSEIKDELIGAIEYIGFRLERKLIAFNLPGNPDYMGPEWELLDGYTHRLLCPMPIQEEGLICIEDTGSTFITAICIKSLSTGEIKELDLKHLMPELFE